MRLTSPREGYRYAKAYETALQEYKIKNLSIEQDQETFMALVIEMYKLGFTIEETIFKEEFDFKGDK